MSYKNGKTNLFDQSSGTTHERLVNIRYNIQVNSNILQTCMYMRSGYITIHYFVGRV